MPRPSAIPISVSCAPLPITMRTLISCFEILPHYRSERRGIRSSRDDDAADWNIRIVDLLTEMDGNRDGTIRCERQKWRSVS